MADLGYPPGQVYRPPELPAYLKYVHDLKPIVGVPQDIDIIGVHSVIHAATRVSGVPGMHDPLLFMKLSDHLFSVQLVRYRSKYSFITFPSDAIYTPPSLPTHVSIRLEPVAGRPSDEEIIKVQDAVRSYQNLSSVPSIFDPHVHMELSQHLFDIQMARHIGLASDTQPRFEEANIKLESPIQHMELPHSTNNETPGATNNIGTGQSAAEVHSTAAGIDARDLMERSNQLTEGFNRALEQFTRLVDQVNTPTERPNPLAGRFDQLCERFDQVVEQFHQSAQRANQLAERSNQLLEQLLPTRDQSSRPEDHFTSMLKGLNQHLQRSNELSEKSNESADQLNRLTERSNQLAEQARKPVERLEVVMKNINRVLVGIQHAIIRNHKDNSLRALDCLVNEAGEVPEVSELTAHTSFDWFLGSQVKEVNNLVPVLIGGTFRDLYIEAFWLGYLLRYYGIGYELLKQSTSAVLGDGMEFSARKRLSRIFSSSGKASGAWTALEGFQLQITAREVSNAYAQPPLLVFYDHSVMGRVRCVDTALAVSLVRLFD